MKRRYNSRISPRANESYGRRARALQIQKQTSILAVLVVICLSILLGSSIRALASAHDKKDLRKYYTSVPLKSGDTLWTIADAYVIDGLMDKESFIEEVTALNHLSDGEIHSGAYIVVPYYSEEEK